MLVSQSSVVAFGAKLMKTTPISPLDLSKQRRTFQKDQNINTHTHTQTHSHTHTHTRNKNENVAMNNDKHGNVDKEHKFI